MKQERLAGPATAAWLKRDAAVITPAYHRYTDVVAVRGVGSHLYDVDGRRFLDFTSGIAVTSLGHGHPAVIEAVKAQVDRLVHVSVSTQHELNIMLSERLVELSPKGLEMCFLANSGAEAVEGAIKLARRVLGRTEIVAFHGAFHGRTYGALSLTDTKPNYREGYEPLLPGVHHVPYPYPLAMGGEAAAMAAFEAGVAGLLERVDAGRIAAIVVEPVLGEGGYVVPPRGFLRRLRELADQWGALLVADEVQTGVARTGRMFASQHEAVVPDVMLLAKALGSGFPISAIVGRRDLMAAWPPAAHGSTFGGNPVSCAAALATLDVVQKEGLVERAARLGESIKGRLQESIGGHAEVAEIRGLGMMVGVELRAKQTQEAVRQACMERNLLVLSCGVQDQVIRLIPPLNIEHADLDTGLAILEESFSAQ